MNALPFALKHWLGRAEYGSQTVLGTGTGALEAVAVGVGPAEAVGAGVVGVGVVGAGVVVGAAVAPEVQDGVAPGVLGHCGGQAERLIIAGPGFVSERTEGRDGTVMQRSVLVLTMLVINPTCAPFLGALPLLRSKLSPDPESNKRAASS
jgi:hypothetical protein